MARGFARRVRLFHERIETRFHASRRAGPGLAAVFLASYPDPSLTGAPASDPGFLPKLATEVAFPNPKFNRPVELTEPRDGSGLLFVVEWHKATIQSSPE